MINGLGNIHINAFTEKFVEDVSELTKVHKKSDGKVYQYEANKEFSPGTPGEVVLDYFEATGDGAVSEERLLQIALRRAHREGTRVDTNGDGVIQASEGRWIQPAFARSYEFAAEQVPPPPIRSIAELRKAARTVIAEELAAVMGYRQDIEIFRGTSDGSFYVKRFEDKEERLERGSLQGFAFEIRGKDGNGKQKHQWSIIVAVNRQSGEVEAAFSGGNDFARGYHFDKEWPGRCRD